MVDKELEYAHGIPSAFHDHAATAGSDGNDRRLAREDPFRFGPGSVDSEPPGNAGRFAEKQGDLAGPGEG